MNRQKVSKAFILGAVAATLAMAACGGSGSSSGPLPESRANVSHYTAQQIVGALELSKDPNAGPNMGLGPAEGLWDASTGCTVDVVLTTPSEVETYAGAGGTVASNPSRTVGVKYGGYQGTNLSDCYHIFTDRLRSLK